MSFHFYHSTKQNRGQVVILAVMFFAVIASFSTALSGFMSSSILDERRSVATAQALTLAEAGIDLGVYQLNQNPSYTGETNTPLGSGTITIAITSIDSSTKRISATAISTFQGQKITKIVKATVTTDSNIVSFNYGVQVGEGGFTLTGGSTINGSIYSNGDIDATSGVHITGSATAANPAATSTDQSNATPFPISSCTSSTCITFGNASATQDLAQSFVISTIEPLNSIQFYIKKVGAPSDATIRIVNDASGAPGTDVLMTATMPASSVSTSFGWVTVSLPATPVLDTNQTYWVVIDGGSNSLKYYVIGANANGYPNGAAKIGSYGGSWSNTTPSGLDAYFQLFLGGGTSIIGGNNYTTGVYVGTTASDNAWAHSVKGATVTGTIFCQTGTYTNKACTGSADPDPQPMPISDSSIQDWKDDALSGGTLTGNQNVGYAGSTMGPKKIVGDLLVNGGGTLTVTGTLWVTGSVTVTGGGKVKLSSSYGANDGAIITDGPVLISGGSSFSGSGTTGSYIFLTTTSSCPAEAGCAGADAISIAGGAGTVALAAQSGNAHIQGGSSLKAIVAKQVTMDGGASLTYDSGLINSNFSSGPGGSFQLVKGTYIIAQ